MPKEKGGRGERADITAALEVLRRAGANREPIPGDELLD